MATVPISFEVYPPRSEDAAPALHEAIEKLSALAPEFISVTFGAGGSDTKGSIAVLRRIMDQGINPLAHITCAGTTRESATELINEFLDAGVCDFLALRGDLPPGQRELHQNSLKTAAELVALIRQLQQEQGKVSVAAFPNGHPESGATRSDIAALIAKQAAGADFAITQLFFFAKDYADFVSLARSSGVTIPILPGIMPITSASRLARVLELTGEREPRELAQGLSNAMSSSDRVEIGLDWAANLAKEVIAMGAPGVHLYAFNEHERVTSVLERAELL